MRKKHKVYRSDEEPQINLTSLIDVVFVILILFILIAPILELDRIELAKGGAKETSVTVTDASLVSIKVHKNNEVFVNDQLVSLDCLADALRLKKELYPQVNPQLFHDKQACFGTYQSVKIAAEAAGFEALDVVLNP
jgi:biopolymer transport protein ExbD